MLEELTPEQVRDEYIEKAYTHVEPDLDKVIEWVHWLYKLANLDLPQVLIVEGHGKAVGLSTELGNKTSVRNAISATIVNVVRKPLTTSMFYAISPAYHTIQEPVEEALTPIYKMPKLHERYFVNYADFGWVARQDFFARIGVLSNEHFNKYKEFCDLGVLSTFQFEGLCIAVKQPLSIKKAHETKLERLQLKTDLIEADKRLGSFIQKHNNRPQLG